MKFLTLNNGLKMPSVGLGLWKVDNAAAPDAVRSAIAAGYRHFDSACDYGNEPGTGAGLRTALEQGLCRREDLWITGKLWNTFHAPEHVRPALERTLSDLGLEYLDLYLIHFPIALRFVPFEERYPPEWIFDPEAPTPRMEPASVPLSETWRAMEEAAASGLVRAIGVCNYNVALLRDLLNYAQTPPAVLQVEMHPYLAQPKLLRFCAASGVAVTAFSPLGAQSYFDLGMARREESLLTHPTTLKVAARCERTPAQALLRWALQRGAAVVPKTARPERMAENLDLFDFELSDEDMALLDGLDAGRRFNDPGVFCESAFNTFFPIYD